MLTRAVVSVALLVFSLIAPSPVGPDGVEAPATVDPNGSLDAVGRHVELAATDTGSQGESQNESDDEDEDDDDSTDGSDFSPPKDPMAGLGQIQDKNVCGWSAMPTPVPADDPAWAGNSPDSGVLKWKSCAVLLPGTPGGPGNLEGRPVILQFFPNDTAVVPPPPDPAVLAQRAIGELIIPRPSIGVGPDRTKLAVNLWTWLWVDNPGTLSSTVTAGGVSVTATASLSSVTWSLGEPITTGDTYSPGEPATVTCDGAGTLPPANYDWKAEPSCGYMFHWRSLKERTSGTGRWPITANANWNVTWTSNTGLTGATTVSTTGNDQLDVQEYRIVLVQGPGG